MREIKINAINFFLSLVEANNQLIVDKQKIQQVNRGKIARKNSQCIGALCACVWTMDKRENKKEHMQICSEV